ncbi:phosphatase PAP2 family protein [Saliphagus infecundisoli]|uniref:Phosphatase PAP2 family protein n=1 Tax=Saliphagus infecundisoli TaxID=1849069 RepID=A0ABD5QDF4_9EURY|nr:phosphatase PAP2 family protein [Saliphagus infecundisoli]
MAFIPIAVLTVLVVLTGLSMTCALCLTPRQLRSVGVGDRLRDVSPYLGAAAVCFLAKRATDGYSLRISRALGWDVTDELHAIEGGFVPAFQEVVPGATLEFFAAMYMFGFPFLIATAPVLYFLSPTGRRLKELLVAYLLNYVVGAICYTLVIAYGPRNHLASVEGLMYVAYPATQDLTAAMSANTDVFPSLHTSLAVVVVCFAWWSRREYPRWYPIAAVVGSGVVLSTMYLGIHWLVDVVAGVALGVGSVHAARRLVARLEDGAGGVSIPADHGEGVPSDAGD